jgi:hypothetical protein
MLGKLIKLGVQVVTDELEAAKKTNTKPFDWNIMGWDKSRPPQTRSNGKSIHNPEHIARKMKTILK